jgi:hypothetical protein
MINLDEYLTTDLKLINRILKINYIYDNIWLTEEPPSKSNVNFVLDAVNNAYRFYYFKKIGIVMVRWLTTTVVDIHLCLYKKGHARFILNNFFTYFKKIGIHKVCSVFRETRQDLLNLCNRVGAKEVKRLDGLVLVEKEL